LFREGKAPKLDKAEFASEKQIELINSLTDSDPAKRPTMETIVSELQKSLPIETESKPKSKSTKDLQKDEGGYLTSPLDVSKLSSNAVEPKKTTDDGYMQSPKTDSVSHVNTNSETEILI
jgi:hypothetical protein